MLCKQKFLKHFSRDFQAFRNFRHLKKTPLFAMFRTDLQNTFYWFFTKPKDWDLSFFYSNYRYLWQIYSSTMYLALWHLFCPHIQKIWFWKNSNFYKMLLTKLENQKTSRNILNHRNDKFLKNALDVYVKSINQLCINVNFNRWKEDYINYMIPYSFCFFSSTTLR